MHTSSIIPNEDVILCTKDTLSKTILSLEKDYEILEINTLTNYFGFSPNFQIIVKKLHGVRKRHSTKKEE